MKGIRGLLKSIIEETQLSEESIRKKSTEILKSIIHNYAAFEVSTIDGFTHRVLRTFAKDLGLPVNFEIALNDFKKPIIRAKRGKILTTSAKIYSLPCHTSFIS